MNLLFRDMVEVGGSVYNGAWDDDGVYDLTMFGGYLMIRTPIADFWGEYSDATTENPSPDGDGEMNGYLFQASRLFQEIFRPTVRIGALDYLDPGSQLGRDPRRGDKDLTEFVLSFAYYPTPKVALKAEYIFFGEGAEGRSSTTTCLDFRRPFGSDYPRTQPTGFGSVHTTFELACHPEEHPLGTRQRTGRKRTYRKKFLVFRAFPSHYSA